FMRVMGWDAAEIGWTFGLVVGVSGATGALGGGMLMDRIYRSGHRDAYFLVTGTVSLIAAPILVSAYFLSSSILALIFLCVGLTMLGVIAAGSYATWQMIAPPALRGQLTACFILVGALMGSGFGPVLVGLVTDFIFGDELMVGY